MWKVLPVTQKPDQCLGEWIDREALAEVDPPEQEDEAAEQEDGDQDEQTDARFERELHVS